MLVTWDEIRARKRRKNEVNRIHRSALSPYNAKDREQSSSGRSPGFWLQTLLISPSHPKQDGGFSPIGEVMRCLPVTVARLRRI